MAHSLRHLIFLSGLFIVLVARLPAATELDASHGPVFRLCAVGVIANMFYDCNGKPVHVSSSQSVSAPFPAPTDGKLLFYRTRPAPNPADPPIRIPQAVAALPSGSSTTLVLLAQGPLPTAGNPTPLPFSTLVTDYSSTASPANTFRIFNLSQHQVAVKLGDTLVQIAPSESHLVPYPQTPVTWLRVAVANTSGWHPVAGSLQVVAPGTRGNIFLAEIPRPDNFAKLAPPSGPIPPALFVSCTFDKPPPPPKEVAQN